MKKETLFSMITLFALKELGIDGGQFIEKLYPSFKNLEWDLYELKLRQVTYLMNKFPEKEKLLKDFFDHYHDDLKDLEHLKEEINSMIDTDLNDFKNLLPNRRRAIAKFTAMHDTQSQKWNIERIPAKAYVQDVHEDDYRAKARIFKEVDIAVTSDPDFLSLLQWMSNEVLQARKNIEKLSITFHQVGIVARPGIPSQIVPEGIHQDGSDYIVSGLVIARENIQGGESIIYGDDKKTEYFRRILVPGEGIFQPDKGSQLWHDVTPIEVDDSSKNGERMIFGFDIDVIG